MMWQANKKAQAQKRISKIVRVAFYILGIGIMILLAIATNAASVLTDNIVIAGGLLFLTTAAGAAFGTLFIIDMIKEEL